MIKITHLLRLQVPFMQFGTLKRGIKDKVTKMEKQSLADEFKSAYAALGQNIKSDNSILDLFQQKVEGNQSDKQMDDNEKVAQYLNRLTLSFQKYYSNLSHDEQIKRSKDFIKSFSLNKDWQANYELNRDYQDYSLFDKNTLGIKYSEKDFIEENSLDNDRLNFLSDLETNIKERSDQERIHSYIYKNPSKQKQNVATNDYGEPIFKVDERLRRFAIDGVDEDNIDLEEGRDAPNDWMIDPDYIQDIRENNDELVQRAHRLSFRSKLEIFDLFNKGWTVRDLSLRFGIFPERVKAVVYQKRYFFDEIFPVISLEMLKDLINLEHQVEKQYGSVDYGVDLEEMAEADQGFLQTNFTTANRNVDIKALGEKEQERLRKFFEKKKSKKYDIVSEKFIGSGNKGYYLKSWIFYKTRSKHGVSKMFERVIKDSDKPYKLPQTVQERLHLGPRLAGAKFGHK